MPLLLEKVKVEEQWACVVSVHRYEIPFLIWTGLTTRFTRSEKQTSSAICHPFMLFVAFQQYKPHVTAEKYQQTKESIKEQHGEC
jgi:hypothetical protein